MRIKCRLGKVVVARRQPVRLPFALWDSAHPFLAAKKTLYRWLNLSNATRDKLLHQRQRDFPSYRSPLAGLDGLPFAEGSVDRCKISRLAIMRMIFHGGAGSRQSATTCQPSRIFHENVRKRVREITIQGRNVGAAHANLRHLEADQNRPALTRRMLEHRFLCGDPHQILAQPTTPSNLPFLVEPLALSTSLVPVQGLSSE